MSYLRPGARRGGVPRHVGHRLPGAMLLHAFGARAWAGDILAAAAGDGGPGGRRLAVSADRAGTWLGGNNRARDGCWLVLVVVEVSCTCESAREILTAGAEGHTDSSLEKAGGRSNPGTRPWIPKVVQQEKATWLRAL